MPPTKKNSPKEIKKIIRRDGSIVDFDLDKIVSAVHKAFNVTGEGDEKEAKKIAKKILTELNKKARSAKEDYIPSVEEVQDLVEKSLIFEQKSATAKAYILYRERRSEVRRVKGDIPPHLRDLAEESKKYFQNPLGEFVFYRSYSRWLEEENRRETWIETIDRFMSFMKENLGKKLTEKEYDEIREAILSQKVMPSMRLLWSAGPAARKSNVCAYNCSFIAPSKIRDFGEMVYLLMCGTGVGFSVESQTAQLLPLIKRQTGEVLSTFVIEDSKEGWADALIFGLKTWFEGKDISFDYSKLRPSGARLKTMGGRSSGPEPLRELLTFAKSKVLKRQGRRLTNLDVHDICCKIGEAVVAGGVRRSALISLSDLDDNDIRHAKDGQFYLTEPQRMLANNSAVYLEKPSNAEFIEEWLALMRGGSGERGIFNRGSLKDQMPSRRWEVFKDDYETSGTNPCGEIILRSKQFCNLSEIVARADDTEDSLLKKARLAAILGTYQSTLTNFKYISKEWQRNCEEERLLGISVTGMWDSSTARKEEVLRKIKDEVIKVNTEYAKRFGINPSTSTTCVKPSGTVSQLVDSSSGMHPRHSKYYIRRIRISASDSLFKMLKDQGVPYFPEVGQAYDSATTYVLEFPVKAPGGSVFKDDLNAIEQLEYWKKVKENYTEHNPSVTISVAEDEWIKVANWLYDNWEIIGGLSFLPRDNHVYKLAPYEEIDAERYKEMVERFKDLDFSKIISYERSDNTQGSKEWACIGNACEIEPIPLEGSDGESEGING